MPQGQWDHECVGFERHAGYRFLFSERRGEGGTVVDPATGESRATEYKPRRVDSSLLLVQWFLVSAVIGIIVMYLGDRPQAPDEKPDV